VKVWRRRQPEEDGSWALVGDLEGRGDILAIAIASGLLIAAGVSASLHCWRLPPSAALRPSDWLQEARRSLHLAPCQHDGRVTGLVASGDRLFSVGHDGRLLRRSAADLAKDAEAASLSPLGGGSDTGLDAEAGLRAGAEETEAEAEEGRRLLCVGLLEDGRRLACGGGAGAVRIVCAERLEEVSCHRGVHAGAPISGVCDLGGGRVGVVSCSAPRLEMVGDV